MLARGACTYSGRREVQVSTEAQKKTAPTQAAAAPVEKEVRDQLCAQQPFLSKGIFAGILYSRIALRRHGSANGLHPLPPSRRSHVAGLLHPGWVAGYR
jgi:hypothetical protein